MAAAASHCPGAVSSRGRPKGVWPVSHVARKKEKNRKEKKRKGKKRGGGEIDDRQKDSGTSETYLGLCLTALPPSILFFLSFFLSFFLFSFSFFLFSFFLYFSSVSSFLRVCLQILKLQPIRDQVRCQSQRYHPSLHKRRSHCQTGIAAFRPEFHVSFRCLFPFVFLSYAPAVMLL